MTRTLPSLALLIACLVLLIAGPAPLAASHEGAATPAEMVDAYETLADGILAMKKTERHMVQAILATTFGHAQATLGSLKRKVDAGQKAGSEVEMLADLVSQLGNEGDAAVAAVRKRLIDGGHHHNAQGEQQGIYDEGFVIVTRAARKEFLAAAGNIARMGAAPDMKQLETEWGKVAGQYRALAGGD